LGNKFSIPSSFIIFLPFWAFSNSIASAVFGKSPKGPYTLFTDEPGGPGGPGRPGRPGRPVKP